MRVWRMYEHHNVVEIEISRYMQEFLKVLKFTLLEQRGENFIFYCILFWSRKKFIVHISASILLILTEANNSIYFFYGSVWSIC